MKTLDEISKSKISIDAVGAYAEFYLKDLEEWIDEFIKELALETWENIKKRKT